MTALKLVVSTATGSPEVGIAVKHEDVSLLIAVACFRVICDQKIPNYCLVKTLPPLFCHNGLSLFLLISDVFMCLVNSKTKQQVM